MRRLASGNTSRSRGFASLKRNERIGVEVIRMGVRRGDDVDHVQPRRIDRPPRHSHVRLVGRGILGRERFGEIWIEQQDRPRVLEQETRFGPATTARSRRRDRWRESRPSNASSDLTGSIIDRA